MRIYMSNILIETNNIVCATSENMTVVTDYPYFDLTKKYEITGISHLIDTLVQDTNLLKYPTTTPTNLFHKNYLLKIDYDSGKNESTVYMAKDGILIKIEGITGNVGNVLKENT